MSDMVPLVVFVGLIAVIIAVWYFTRRGDHKCITENIEEHGGKIIQIVRSWSGTRWERTYNVTFTTAKGARLQATCKTDGAVVYWLNDKPPDR
jgi:hypothetical protein